FFVNYKKNFFISRIKTNLKCYKSISERYAIYEQLELEELLSQSKDSIGTEKYNKLKVCLVGVKLSDDIATKCIRKAIIQNNGADIDVYKCQFLHWNLMITNINRETFNASIITELYRMRWQIELLFKVLKNILSIDKMHVGKTKYVEAILYGKLLGALLTMLLYDCIMIVS
ncbi:transposase, partial [Cellulosilyticum ruminicola]|uniref:transposase n=1 Tax=Cellulosilyticum ruminicola TaxID=425254 RepID=UPI0012ED242E